MFVILAFSLCIHLVSVIFSRMLFFEVSFRFVNVLTSLFFTLGGEFGNWKIDEKIVVDESTNLTLINKRPNHR